MKSSATSPLATEAAPAAGLEALAYHLEVARALRARSATGKPYRALLELLAGVDLQRCLVSTAEHMAPFNRAHTASFVLPQLALAGWPDPPADILILAGSLIPLDNGHYPRGFLLPDRPDSRARFNLFPQRQQKCSPLLLDAVDGAALPGGEALLEHHPFLADGLRPRPGESYARQVARWMSAIAARWVAGDGGAPVLRVLPLEEIAAHLLMLLLERRDPYCEAVLLNPDARAFLHQRLKGVFCAWGERQGSFLFWAAAGGRITRLRERDGMLEGDGFALPCDRDALVAALRSRAIVPGVFLSLFAVSYLPALPIAGGLKQAQYFPAMLEALNAVTGLARSPDLGVVGYGTITVDRLRPSAGAPPIRDWGCGLGIAASGLDRADLRAQLAATVADLSPPRRFVLA